MSRHLVTAAVAGLALLTAAPALAQGDRPNLEALSITAPGSGLAGSTIHLSATVAVSGSVASFGWSAHLTQGGAIRGSTRIGTYGPVRPGADGTVQLEQDVVLPAVPAGSYVIAIQLDPTSAITERNEYDNVAAASAATRVRVPSADVRVSSVRLLDPRRQAGETVRIQAGVTNAGESAATVTVAALLSADDAVTTSDPELGRSTISLAAGQTATVELEGTLPAPLSTGDYVIGVLADPELSLPEANELDNLGLAADPLNVFSGTLELRTADLPGGTVFIPYFAKLDARGGDGHFTYAIAAGRLPAGLTLDATTGEISGTPTQSGAIQLDLVVQSGGLTDLATYTVIVSESGVELTIVTPSLEGATLGLAYEETLTVAGGEPPYRWDLRSGFLPPGLDLGNDGRIRGVPSQEGRYTFHVGVSDALGGAVTAELSIEVDAPNVAVLSGALDDLPVGEPVSIQLEVTGGKPPYTWTALSSPPPGLTVTEDGVVSGTPSELGRFAVRVRVTDGSRIGGSDTALVQIDVVDAGEFAITTTELPELEVREQLDVTLELAGGRAPFTWRIAPGSSLPEGFRLEQDEDGQARLFGASIRPVVQPFTVQVEDAFGREREALLVIQADFRGGVETGGCRCSTPSSSDSAALGLLLVAGALIWMRRRSA